MRETTHHQQWLDDTYARRAVLQKGEEAISKARSATRCDVIYTLAKNVKKPKGLPAGRVTTTNTKTLSVDMEEERLKRLLDSLVEDDAS